MSDDASARVVGTGKTARLTVYHYLNQEHSRSLCGTLQNDSDYQVNVAVTLTEDAAEEYGLHLCARCADCDDQTDPHETDQP